MFGVGQQGNGWTFASASIGGSSAWYFSRGYIAPPPGGQAVNAHVYINQLGSASMATVYIYSGVGPGATLVAMSSEIDVTQLGDRFAPISANIVPGPYTLVFQPSGALQTWPATNSGSNGFVENQNTSGSINYRAPPAILPAADTVNVGQEFVLWIELLNRGRTPVIGPAKFRPQAGGSIGAQANLIALCASRSSVIASLTAPTATMLVGQRPVWGPGLPAPFNLNQFPGALGTQQRPQAVLLATSSSRSSISATLTTGIPLAASLAAQTNVAPNLTTTIALFAVTAASTVVTPALTNGIALASSPAGDTIVSCTLATAIPLACSAFGLTTVNANIAGGAVLNSSLTARTSVGAALTTGIQLNAQAFGKTFAQATLSKPITFVASLAATTSVSADLSIGSGFSAISATRSSVTATLGTSASLSAICGGRTNVTASLVQTIYRGDLIPIPPDDRRIVLKPDRRKV